MSSHAPRLLATSQSICLCSGVRITITIHAGASFRAVVVCISCISYHRLKVENDLVRKERDEHILVMPEDDFDGKVVRGP